MRGLKRLTCGALRQGARKGRKVLYVWDRAGIDFAQCYQWKQGSGIYMLSRCKSNMALQVCGNLTFDGDNDLNAGVFKDQLVGTGTQGLIFRRVTFHDAATDRHLEFITNLTDRAIAPRLLSHLYRMRWDIEKSFDEFKTNWESKRPGRAVRRQKPCRRNCSA